MTKRDNGFTLIEVIIAAAVFLIFAMGIYQAYVSIYSAITITRQRALAVDLANARFEIIKNIPYTDVGTVGGNPAGILAAVETTISDRVSFAVTTTIVNVDDPFDGLSGGGDLFPADYKLVEIKIECASCKNFVPMIITGIVAPKNLES
jgi:prepilin-type N-terminal cleavage/methylation domain-containing protein